MHIYCSMYAYKFLNRIIFIRNFCIILLRNLYCWVYSADLWMLNDFTMSHVQKHGPDDPDLNKSIFGIKLKKEINFFLN
jgi:hypothetical protein